MTITPDHADGEARGFRPGSRRRARIAAGVAIAAVVVLANVLIYTSLSDSTEVVQFVDNVRAGEQIAGDDVRLVEVDGDVSGANTEGLHRVISPLAASDDPIQITLNSARPDIDWWAITLPLAGAALVAVGAAYLAHVARLRQWRYERMQDACATYVTSFNRWLSLFYEKFQIVRFDRHDEPVNWDDFFDDIESLVTSQTFRTYLSDQTALSLICPMGIVGDAQRVGKRMLIAPVLLGQVGSAIRKREREGESDNPEDHLDGMTVDEHRERVEQWLRGTTRDVECFILAARRASRSEPWSLVSRRQFGGPSQSERYERPPSA